MGIDTLSIARDLKATELPATQAEAIAAAIGRSVTDGAASKSEMDAVLLRLETMEQRLSARFDALEGQLAAKIESSRSTLLTWLVGVIFATAGVLIAVVKL